MKASHLIVLRALVLRIGENIPTVVIWWIVIILMYLIVNEFLVLIHSNSSRVGATGKICKQLDNKQNSEIIQ